MPAARMMLFGTMWYCLLRSARIVLGVNNKQVRDGGTEHDSSPFRNGAPDTPLLLIRLFSLLLLFLSWLPISGKTFTEMEGLVVRLANAREACLTKSNAPPAIEAR